MKIETGIACAGAVTPMLEAGLTPEELLRKVLCEFELEFFDEEPVEYRCYCSRDRVSATLITIGKKAQEHYAKRPVTVAADYPGIAETMRISDTHPIVEDMLKLFREGKVDEVFLCYTEFISPLQQEPKCLKLLPAHFDAADKQPAGAHVLTEYDPSPESVFDAVIPEYLYGVLYGAVVESYCSEQSARRMAMEAASDNAGEMIENLNLSYNRARQAAITQEITEIVAGSGEVGA